MISEQEVRSAHKTTQAVYPHALVLLGGSYWRGNASDNSDLDLYVIAGWRHFWFYARDTHRAARVKTDCPVAKIMFVPKCLWSKGYYSISGVDLKERVHHSDLNWRFVFRNALKLGYLYYLKSRLGDTDYWSKKAAQQIEQLKLASRELQGSIPEASDSLAVLDELAERVGEQTRFSWLNYFVYNLYFLRLGCGRFLLTNPDQLIWRCLRTAAHLPQMDKLMVEDLNKYAFIVLIR